jgi:hypothetical protein
MTKAIYIFLRIVRLFSMPPFAALIAVMSMASADFGQDAVVFQAAGPNAGSIQGTVDQFRAALGGGNNANLPGPLDAGRREINWDGGGSTATSLGPTPFDVFLNIRGNRSITPGTGFVQAPAAGLADTFGNASYTNIFKAFSPVRLFSPIGSNVTETVSSFQGHSVVRRLQHAVSE